MKRKQLLKLILVVSLASILAIVVPSLTGCLGRPAVAPPEAPPEVAPAEEAPPVTQVSAVIKIEATSSTWREGEEPYDIYNAIKEKLEGVGFAVASEAYDATLRVDYEESKGGEYTEGGHGTRIKCSLKLRDKTDNLLFEKEISASTSFMVRGLSLYGDAVTNFKSELYFKYLGEIIATKFGVGDDFSVLLSVLKDRDEDERVRQEAADVLGEMGDERAVETLIQILRDKEEDVRNAAARALGEIGDRRAVETLIQVLKEKNKYLQNTAAEALGEIGDERAIEPLTDALEDEEEYVREAAREALEKIEASEPSPPSPEPITEGERTIAAPRLQNAVTLDGRISGSEWDDVGQLPLNFVYTRDASSVTYPGGIYLKHDGTYLWICILVQDEDENKYPEMYDYAAVLFDANGDGEIGDGDDSAIVHHGLGPLDLRPGEGGVWLPDTEFGGNNDVIGESGWAGGWYTYEMRKPLDAGDAKGYDIAISPGDTVLSSSCFWDIGEAPGWSADAGGFYIELEP